MFLYKKKKEIMETGSQANEENKSQMLQILEAAIAEYLQVPKERINIVSYVERTDDCTDSFKYLNTDGRERNEELFRKSQWKNI